MAPISNCLHKRGFAWKDKYIYFFSCVICETMTTESTFEMYENSSAPECIRVATVGNVDSGKSTLVR